MEADQLDPGVGTRSECAGAGDVEGGGCALILFLFLSLLVFLYPRTRFGKKRRPQAFSKPAQGSALGKCADNGPALKGQGPTINL
jgi:hypothetical protein